MRMLPYDRYGSVSHTMAILVHKSSLHLSINTVPDTVFLLNQVITFLYVRDIGSDLSKRLCI